MEMGRGQRVLPTKQQGREGRRGDGEEGRGGEGGKRKHIKLDEVIKSNHFMALNLLTLSYQSLLILSSI